jgi:hypothetical protein
MFNNNVGDNEMCDTTEQSKKTAKQIVDNLNDISATAKNRSGSKYIKAGKASVKMPDVDSNIGTKLGEYAEKQVKTIGSATKKIKKNVDVE